MRHFSYRNKLRLRGALIWSSSIVAILALLAVGLIVYMHRFVVYTSTGAYLDFDSQIVTDDSGNFPLNPEFIVETTPPLIPPTVVVENPSDTDYSDAPDLIQGIYIDETMFENQSALDEALKPTGSQLSVLVDLKSIYGNFYYSSQLTGAQTSSAVDVGAVDALLETILDRSDVYAIARVPSLRDSDFALNNQSAGLALASGALWMDEDNCYWLNPTDPMVISHLQSIATELATMGFDEIVWDDFYFPTSGNIQFEGNGNEAIAASAKLLADTLADVIAVSYATTDPALLEFGARIYVEQSDGGEAAALASQLTSDQPLSQRLVFLTHSRDTRFDAYGLLAPAISQETQP